MFVSTEHWRPMLAIGSKTDAKLSFTHYIYKLSHCRPTEEGR